MPCSVCLPVAHDTGLVTLQVAVSNQIISNSVVFEYKARALPSLPSSQHDWLSLDGTALLFFSNCCFVALASFSRGASVTVFMVCACVSVLIFLSLE